MEIAPPNVELPFEVTYSSPSLPVAMSVYDMTSGTPVLISGPTAMVNLSGTNTYVGLFTLAIEKTYLILKAVYTDLSFSVLDTDYSQGSETITTTGSSGGSGSASSCELVGYIQNNNPVVGFIINDPLVGFVEC